MLTFCCIALAHAVFAGEKKPAEKFEANNADTLRFLNNDVLHGKLVAAGRDFVTWQSAGAQRAIQFRTGNIAEVQFAPRPQNVMSSLLTAATVRVALVNGDEIPGHLVAFNSDQLELQTPFAGKISLPRKMLKFITPARVSATAIYEGPSGMQGWRGHGGEMTWHFQKNALVTHQSGVIAREIDWPELVSIEFDLSWKGALGFALGMYLTSLNDSEGDGTMLMLGDGMADLMRLRHGNTEQVGAAAEALVLSQNDQTHVKIYVNRKKRTTTLLLDGVLVHQWTDRIEPRARGRWFVLGSQNDATVRVSNVRIAAWNGRAEADEIDEASGDDVLHLNNGDRVSGKLQSIEKSNIAFYTTHGSLVVPLQTIEGIAFAARALPSEPKPGEVRAFFGGGTRATLALEKWDAKQAVATLAASGRANLTTAAIQRIEFHAKPVNRDDEYDEPSNVESPR